MSLALRELPRSSPLLLLFFAGNAPHGKRQRAQAFAGNLRSIGVIAIVEHPFRAI